MEMGNSGVVNITPEMMKNAQSAIENYQSTTKTLYANLNATIASLIPGNFSGAAADGFKYFYDTNIVPAVDTDLTNLLNTLNSIVDSILKGIPDNDGLDDQLAAGNKQDKEAV